MCADLDVAGIVSQLEDLIMCYAVEATSAPVLSPPAEPTIAGALASSVPAASSSILSPIQPPSGRCFQTFEDDILILISLFEKNVFKTYF